MTWLRYASNDYQPDINIRLEDVVGLTVGPLDGRFTSSFFTVTVFYSDGQSMNVGTFCNPILNDPKSNEGFELARQRAEEIKAAVDKAKGVPLFAKQFELTDKE